MDKQNAPQDSDRAISRRTVIRTAAHAAWAVPVISAVSAAPAFAASNDILENSATLVIDGSRTFGTLTVTVTNDARGTLPANGVEVRLTAVTTQVGSAAPVVQPLSGASITSRTGTAVSPTNTWSPTTFGSALPYVVSIPTIPNNSAATFVMRIDFVAKSKPDLGATVAVSGTVATGSDFKDRSISLAASDLA